MRPRVSMWSVIPCLAALATAGAAFAQADAPKGSGAAVAPAAGPRVFKLTNGGKSSIDAVYAAPAGTTNLSDDLLGKQVAGAGKTVTLRVNDKAGACIYDLQLLMNNGDTKDIKGLDLCKSSAFSYPQ